MTITGTDLGVTVDDVMDVSFGNSACRTQSYIAGIGRNLQVKITDHLSLN